MKYLAQLALVLTFLGATSAYAGDSLHLKYDALPVKLYEARSIENHDLNPQGLCYEIENTVNAMLGTYTKCLPAAGTRPGTTSLIMISEKTVFSKDSIIMKVWLAAVVGSVGHAGREQAKLFRFDKLIVSDVEMMKKGKAWTLPIETAKELQRKTYNGDITVDQLFSEIHKALAPFNIPRPGR